ncbi:MAG TPA: hypothetical protein VGV15_00510, partial [Terriglobales bacterium]|nr:hypothetical protein [Terriglobales bacterium]
MNVPLNFVLLAAGNPPALLRDWREDTVAFVHHNAPKLVMIIVGALVLSRVLRITVRRIAALEERRLPSGIRAQKIRTMASVITSVGVFVIFFWAVLQALPLFGLNLGPLLASAGIAGLAIGFGAQTLVH